MWQKGQIGYKIWKSSISLPNVRIQISNFKSVFLKPLAIDIIVATGIVSTAATILMFRIVLEIIKIRIILLNGLWYRGNVCASLLYKHS